jgi:predicted DNA binding CopG/RHH family protein
MATKQQINNMNQEIKGHGDQINEFRHQQQINSFQEIPKGQMMQYQNMHNADRMREPQPIIPNNQQIVTFNNTNM